MELVAPAGPMYQAGTLSGNPLAMVAGLKTLEILDRPGAYEHLAARSRQFVEGLKDTASAAGIPLQADHVGGMFGFFFSEVPITSFADAKAHGDAARFGRFHRGMLERGVYLAPSAYEAGFTSLAHTEADVEQTIAAAREVMKTL
jgi:glutamate-1-semialdehyde 2,1-aminomutase